MKKNDLQDRRANAATAKSGLIDAYRAAQAEDAPRLQALREERAAVAAARALRHAERDALKRAEKETKAAELAAAKVEAARDAEAEAVVAAQQASDAMISQIVLDHAARKAERDLRYLNRQKNSARR